jgi:hypothetical protein
MTENKRAIATDLKRLDVGSTIGLRRIQIDRIIPKLRDASQLVTRGFDCDCDLCPHHSVQLLAIETCD